MKQLIYTALITCFSTLSYAVNKTVLRDSKKIPNANEISFTENKGQVHDQNFNTRPDVLYGVMAGNMAVHIKNSGVSYQLYKTDSWKEEADVKNNKIRKEVDKQTIYRVDLNWINANNNFTQSHDEVLPGFNNYYFDNCPDGALNVKSYKGITLNNLYPGINLHYYEKNGELKHDYIVAPHADYKKIQLKIDGAEIKLNTDGTLFLITSLGKIQEGAPIVLQGGKQLNAKWKLTQNILSFEIENYNPSLELIIDPVTRLWGTYYGGAGVDVGYSCVASASGDVYMAGYTTSNAGTLIATVGSHQATTGGGSDAYLAKFNGAGVRQWATYYGGTAVDFAYTCCVDGFGNVYTSGYSASSNNISTAGSHQSTFGGGTSDAFLVKFNSNGIRQWGTYYGGTSVEYGWSCVSDNSGNVYLTGSTTSSNVGNVIATIGSHQSTYGGGAAHDAFLVKFDASGVRQWGTYYGGTNSDIAYSCIVDLFGNVYIGGETGTSTGTIIATVSSHQAAYGGGTMDAFLVKFDNAGVRQWGTYYGGAGNDFGRSCASDPTGKIYIAGFTSSNTGNSIASAGSFQSTHGGSTYDAYLAKFDNAGIRQWGTYYGWIGGDKGNACTTDASGNVYLAGETASTGGTTIATPGSHQSAYGGGTEDAFVVKFNGTGARQWGTYYSGANGDYIYGCSADNSGGIFVTGEALTNTGTSIASVGSHQTAYGGGTNDAFLAKLYDCTPANPANTTPVLNQNICAGNNTTLSANSGTNTINWYASPTSTTILGTGTTFTTPVLSAGTYSYYAEANGCAISDGRTAISITVNATPTISVNNGTICSGSSFTIIPNGASTYTIQGGNTIVSPTTTTGYTVVGTSTAGCVSANTATSNITVNASPTISVNSGSICAGDSFTISPSGASTYTLQGGNAVVSPTANASYTVVGTSTAGCVSSSPATSNVTVSPLPIISASTSNTMLCVGQSATITASGASTYTFNPGGAGSSIVVSPTVTSTYTISGTSGQGCNNSSVFTQSVSTCTGINQISNSISEIILYPNPFNSKITIASNGKKHTVQIFNATGSLIYDGKTENEKIEIDLGKEASGMYFVKIGEDIKKIIKE